MSTSFAEAMKYRRIECGKSTGALRVVSDTLLCRCNPQSMTVGATDCAIAYISRLNPRADHIEVFDIEESRRQINGI